jgi:uncharacterized protein (DUF1684 family)
MDTTEHLRVIEAWRAAREHRLRTSDGWLTLVDRLLLDPGDNALPFGVANLEGDVVRVRVQPERAADVTVDGQPVVERALQPREGVPSDVFVFEGRTYEIYRRGDAFAVRVKDPQSAALRNFSGLTYFPIDPAWRIAAAFERYHPPRTTVHALDVGASGPRQVPGLARFAIEGRPLALEPTLEEDTQRLFFVFADKTTGRESSPAGRFLYADLPGTDDTVILDFNRAFNPPCAFTPFATCPIPPPGNRLPVPVAAGEKDYPHI